MAEFENNIDLFFQDRISRINIKSKKKSNPSESFFKKAVITLSSLEYSTNTKLSAQLRNRGIETEPNFQLVPSEFKKKDEFKEKENNNMIESKNESDIIKDESSSEIKPKNWSQLTKTIKWNLINTFLELKKDEKNITDEEYNEYLKILKNLLIEHNKLPKEKRINVKYDKIEKKIKNITTENLTL